jgi:hypothetical protein
MDRIISMGKTYFDLPELGPISLWMSAGSTGVRVVLMADTGVYDQIKIFYDSKIMGFSWLSTIKADNWKPHSWIWNGPADNIGLRLSLTKL